jgi:hypothetical protein
MNSSFVFARLAVASRLALACGVIGLVWFLTLLVTG